MINQSEKISSSKNDFSDAVIGTGLYVEGNLIVHGSIMIEGYLHGDLTATGKLILGESGKIEGTIQVKEAIVNGVINGNITVTQSAVLESSASLNGDLFAGKVTLSEGSKFNGKCKMIKQKELVVDKQTKKINLIELSPEEILTRK